MIPMMISLMNYLQELNYLNDADGGVAANACEELCKRGWKWNPICEYFISEIIDHALKKEKHLLVHLYLRHYYQFWKNGYLPKISNTVGGLSFRMKKMKSWKTGLTF